MTLQHVLTRQSAVVLMAATALTLGSSTNACTCSTFRTHPKATPP